MNIYIYKNDQQLGPFDDAQISEALTSGEFSLEDLAWKEGLTEWVRLENLLQKPQKMTALAEARPTAQSKFIPQSISGIENTPTIVVKKNEPLSIWALVLGIVSLVTCLGGFLTAIPAVICGHLGLSRIKRQPLLGGRGMAIAGLITGYLGILICILISAIFAIPFLLYGAMDLVIIPNLKSAAGKPAASHEEQNPKAVSALGEHTAEFGELVVALSGTGRYLCINFVVASADSKIGEIIKQNDASLRGAATAIISAQSLDDLDREVLRKQLIGKFNSLLGAEVIDQIYFTKLLIQ